VQHEEPLVKSSTLLILVIITVVSAFLSFYIAVNVEGTDFPVFYTAAKRILDESHSIEMIYQTHMTGLDILPERYPHDNYFIYSPVIALLFAPLAHFSYFTAKAIMVFINIFAYFVAIYLILKMLEKCTWRFFILSTLFMWMPFITNFCGAQVNCLLLLLIVAALFISEKPAVSGSLLGLAALCKVFPLAVALLVGTLRRQIAITCFGIFALALLVPGSHYWLDAMPTVSAGHTPLFLFLSQYGIGWFLSFSITIIFLSSITLYRTRPESPLAVFAYALPAALAAMPVVQYHHLLLLTLTYSVFFLSDILFINRKWYGLLLLGTLAHINLNAFFETTPHSYWSVLLVWAVLTMSMPVTSHSRPLLGPFRRDVSFL
jgi:hypothetical protein